MKDPRYYQIAALTGLLLYGLFVLDFEVKVSILLSIFTVALVTQYFFTIIYKLPFFDPRSALISSLSLCLLLRTNSIGFACLAAFIAINSKFLIRINGKHVFNPTNFALVTLLTISNSVWVSPGQWGHIAYFTFLSACLGMLVIFRARRFDVTLAFILSYVVIVLARAIWLGDPLSIPLHQLQSGSLLLFAFFMISDPMTCPDSRTGRIIFAVLVASVGSYVQFYLYEPSGVLYALIVFNLTVPLIDCLIPDERYQWQSGKTIITKMNL